jgi:two-component system, chemotaxis family, CheB/CheR fusion protein
MAVHEEPLIVVGVGASAGGLEALEIMFDHVSADSRMAFVVIQHLSPDFRSLMDELLARHTRLTIHRVENGMMVEPNSIYLIPPKKEMIISNGRLLLSDKDQSAQFTLPIDIFFRSLAQDFKTASVGVILSGTGSDGSIGVSKIHEAGGLVIVQSEDSAKFNGMPRSAIETGMADLVVPPEKIGSLLSRYAAIPGREAFLAELASDSASEPMLQMVFSALQRDFGLDFRQYKPGTMLRRLHRRSVLANCNSVEEYASAIITNEAERKALYEDLLIGVTHFFRDPEMFESLRSEIENRITTLWKDETIRVWVCGCSTGQEAYTVAMILHDLLDKHGKTVVAKIFATDIDRASIDFAGRGLYGSTAIQDIPEDMLSKYFKITVHGYQIVPEIRQMITFAPHNALRDAPFTNLHLATCRNFLIYLNNDAQQKVLSLLYFGLKANGILFLGSSESPGDISADVTVLDSSAKIFLKTGATRQHAQRKPSVDMLGMTIPAIPVRPVHRPTSPGMITPELLNVYDMLLTKFMSAAVLINQEGSVVQVFGGGVKFLKIPTGRITSKLAELVNEDLLLAVNGAVHRARKTLEPVAIDKVRVKINDQEECIGIVASPVTPKSGQIFVLVQFETNDPSDAILVRESEASLIASTAEQLDELSVELNYTKENLNATIEELETSNEELQATNEEMIASNEELQSTNEELHSVNEELYTVNAEYQKKIVELTKLNNDFDNLLSSTEIHTVFLDSDLNIRMFTPKSVEIFNFSASDLGRKFDSFTHKLQLSSLSDDLRRVHETGKPVEREVVDQRSISFLLRILPYLASGKVCGVVISLLDITSRIEWENRLQYSNDRFERAVAATRDGIWDWPNVRNDAMWWSPMCYEILGYESNEFPSLYSKWIELIHPEDAERVRQTTIPHQGNCYVELHRSFEYRMRHKSGDYRWFEHRTLIVNDDSGKAVRMTGSIVDIQVRKELEQSLRDQVRHRDDFLAVLSHELRNPLGAVTNALALFRKEGHSVEQDEIAFRIINEQAHHMSRLLDDLLDVSRVSHNKFELRKTEFSLQETVTDVLDSVRTRAERNGVKLQLKMAECPVRIVADRDRILQCQVNLVGNAIKFTKRGGLVEYSIREDQGMACIEVRDNGVGMSEALSKKIFELFSQGANEPRNGDSGIGVGLALVRSIGELHDGTVTAHSDGLEKGSVFTMKLPLCSHPIWIGKEKKDVTESKTEIGHSKKVLVIDDLPEGRSMLAQLLSLEGYDVIEAETGMAGLQMAVDQNVDVALIDLGLPDISGHEVAKRIRERSENRSMRLIAITGYGQASDMVKTQESGFHYHLTKPVDLERLFELLQSP